jgi:hypothetical protein
LKFVCRGTPFFTKLSGTVTATPGSSLVKTSEDLTKEIRRGGVYVTQHFTLRIFPLLYIEYCFCKSCTLSLLILHSRRKSFRSYTHVKCPPTDTDTDTGSVSDLIGFISLFLSHFSSLLFSYSFS